MGLPGVLIESPSLEQTRQTSVTNGLHLIDTALEQEDRLDGY